MYLSVSPGKAFVQGLYNCQFQVRLLFLEIAGGGVFFMTDNQIRSIFRRLFWEKLVGFCADLNQSVTLILVPGTHSRPISLKFRPIWVVLLVVSLLGIGVGGTLVLSSRAKSRLVKAALVGELEENRKALDDVHVQIEDMVQLMDQFQNTMSLFDSNRSDLGTDFRAQDFTDVTAAVGMAGATNMSDVERLQLVNASIQNSMAPLKDSLNLLANQKRLLSELPTAWPVKNLKREFRFCLGRILNRSTAVAGICTVALILLVAQVRQFLRLPMEKLLKSIIALLVMEIMLLSSINMAYILCMPINKEFLLVLAILFRRAKRLALWARPDGLQAGTFTLRFA